MSLALPLLLLAGASSAHAATPCGGLEASDGGFVFRERLTLEGVRQAGGDACLKAVADEIQKRTTLLSVTIAARVPNDKVMREKGLETANLVAEKLAGFGVSRSLLSVVVPTARPDEPDAIHIAFSERRSARPVSQVQALSGIVKVGGQLGSLRDTAPGALLVPGDFLETGGGSIALMSLLDGSQLFVFERSILRMSTIEITASGARKAKVQLLRGEAMVWASSLEGPLDFVTGNATAGVRGTDFRVSAPDAQTTRVETYEGTVVLGGRQSDRFVPAGQGSRIDFKGMPEELRPLLVSPEPTTPLFGDAGSGGFLRWKPVPNANGYRVELADNAQFTKSWWSFEVTNEQWLISGELKPGKHFWRVTAIDPEGYLGYPSKIYAFTSH